MNQHVQHESCECKCELNESLCNSKQKWNHDECWCGCKKLHDSSFYKNDYMWNLSTCNSECNKACKIDKYLDTKNFSRNKRLFGRLVLACEDEILTTTQTSLDDKKVTREKISALLIRFHW